MPNQLPHPSLPFKHTSPAPLRCDEYPMICASPFFWWRINFLSWWEIVPSFPHRPPESTIWLVVTEIVLGVSAGESGYTPSRHCVIRSDGSFRRQAVVFVNALVVMLVVVAVIVAIDCFFSDVVFLMIVVYAKTSAN